MRPQILLSCPCHCLQMADLTKSEALGASYATLAFFFIAAICVALLPQFRKTFGADADSYLVSRAALCCTAR